MKMLTKIDTFSRRLAPPRLSFVVLYGLLVFISMFTAVTMLKSSLWGVTWFLIVLICMWLFSAALGGWFSKKIIYGQQTQDS